MKPSSRKIRTALCLALCTSMLCGCGQTSKKPDSADADKTEKSSSSKKKSKDSEELYEELAASFAEKAATPEWTDPVPNGKEIEYFEVHMKTTYAQDDDDDNYSEYRCEYDDRGRMSVKVEKYGKGSIRTVFTYNDENLVIKEEDFYEGDVPTNSKDVYYEYKYDEKGNLLSKNLFEVDGTLRFEYKFAYDDAGNLIREEYGDIIYTYEYEYINDVLHSQTQTTGEGENLSTTKTTYDEKGNIVHIESKTPYSDSDTRIEYDEHNNRIRYSSAVEGRREYEDEITYEYDENGNVLKKEESSLVGDYDTDGPSKTTVTYTYDAHGLLVCEVTRKDGAFYTFREYDYEPIAVPMKTD